MDTTSNNFTWQMYTLGEYSTLHDVVIVNDTFVIAVGNIYQPDSGTTYTVATWNGIRWKLSHGSYAEMRAVFALSDSDIWAGTSAPYRWDGSMWHPYRIDPGVFNGYINRFWGTSDSNMYMVGTNGSIAHFDGRTWNQLESSTTLDIQDIWGSVNSKTGQLEVIAVASLPYSSYDRKILSIRGTTVTPLSDDFISTSVTGAWFLPGKKYFVSGDGVYTKQDPYDTTFIWLPDPATYASTFYEWAIRGIDLNDIAIAGDAGEILHFNGVRWQSYRSITHLDYANFHSVAFKGNMIVAVGDNFDAAVVAIGRR
jgi:hypothetical protein